MSSTLLVSKLSDWLKADAPLNINCMCDTLDVSKSTGWLKALAPLNIANMWHVVKPNTRTKTDTAQSRQMVRYPPMVTISIA